MSRSRVRASNKILKWIRACKVGEDIKKRPNTFYKCVLEERFADPSTKTRDPSRKEGARIDRAICKATGGRVDRRSGICRR